MVMKRSTTTILEKMNVDKVPKVESSDVNRNPSGRIQGSSTSSKACSSNNRVNDISGGNNTIKSSLSCNRVLCSSDASKPSTSNKNEVKTSSSNTKKTWNESCRRLLCSFGGSKSKRSSSTQVDVNKKIEVRSPVEGSSNNDSRSLTIRPSVSSPKQVMPCGNNKEKESGHTDNSTASNPAHLKNQIQKTAIPKVPVPYNLRNRVEKSEVSKDTPVATRKKETHKTEGPKASTVASVKREIPKPVVPKHSLTSTVASVKREIPKAVVPKHSLTGTLKIETRREEAQKTSVSKLPSAPTKKIDTTKNSTPYYEEKDQPSSSHYDPYSDIPVYHIRWDGHEDEYEPSGQKCTLCEKDLSCSPNGNDRGSHENADFKYQIHFRPRIHPAVDILPCGHIFHTECSKFAISEGESNDPECVFCLSMV